MKHLVLLSAVVAGCLGSVDVPSDGYSHSEAGSPPASYLCVGMEVSERFGSCPGCEKDARGLSGLMEREMGYSGEVLVSEQATKSAVVDRLRAGVDGTPEDGLFLFFYSGHGGQEYMGGREPDGSDRMDEYLCLYDAPLLDDEIWEIVSKCRGRVFLYFDACHSATMYRSARPLAPGQAVALSVDMVKSSGFTFSPRVKPVAVALDASVRAPRVLSWSGCEEGAYSFGSDRGGVMTTSLLKEWKRKVSYSLLWEAVSNRVQSVQKEQSPVQTYIGGGFDGGMEAFR